MAEFQQWVKYIALRGTLNWGERIEDGSALIAWLVANKVSGYSPKGQPFGVIKKKNGTTFAIRDFMPHADPEPEEDLSVSKFLAVLGGKPRRSRKKRKAAPEE